jgi:hypothetical protein
LKEKIPEIQEYNDINELPDLKSFEEDKKNEKLLIVDDSIYDNFDLLVKAPINLERRVKSGQVIAFKHAPGVYSLVQKDIAINVMNSEF